MAEDSARCQSAVLAAAPEMGFGGIMSGFRIQERGIWMLDVGCWMSDAGSHKPDIRYPASDIQCSEEQRCALRRL
jgi:hypothetical protein